jgi:uncharacterized membrane protein
MAGLSIGVAIFSYRYLPAVGPLQRTVLANAFARPWLLVHILGAATALLIGAFQFLPGVRQRWPGRHRWVGRVYVAGCMVGGAAGLVIALGSTAGPIASLGFGLLAVLWLFTTGVAWRMARAGRYADHRAWMIRSWALTLAAVTLRLYLPLALVLGAPMPGAYRAIAFLAWMPNLALAELYLRRGPSRVRAI